MTSRSRIRIPYKPPEEYDFEVTFTRNEGSNDVIQLFPKGSSGAAFTMASWGNRFGGFATLKDAPCEANPTCIEANGFLRNGRKYTAIVYVRKRYIAASIDGKLVAHYPTDSSDLSIHQEWAVGDGVLGVGAAVSSTTFHRIILREILGNGRQLELPPASTEATPPAAVAPFDAAQARAHQEAWAKHLKIPVEQRNAIGMRLTLIPPGEFMMGSTDEQLEATRRILDEFKVSDPRHVEWGNAQLPLEQPRHQVALAKPCLIGETEVTIGQFRRFVNATGYVTEAEQFGGGDSDSREERDPLKKSRHMAYARFQSDRRLPRYPNLVDRRGGDVQLAERSRKPFALLQARDERRVEIGSRRNRLSTADRSRMGVRLPRRHHHALLVWRRLQKTGRLRVVRQQPRLPPGRTQAGQPVWTFGYARKRLRVVPRLVRRGLLLQVAWH